MANLSTSAGSPELDSNQRPAHYERAAVCGTEPANTGQSGDSGRDVVNGFTPQPAHLLPAVPSSSQLYSTWYKMLARCHNPADPKYPYYGGRGIRVCKDWRGAIGLRVFAAYMGERPSPQHTLGRIDNDKGYEPGNVRWETWTQQQNNRRSSVRITVGGRSQTLAQWAAETGIDRQLIQTRKNRGWAIEVAVVTPKGVRKEAAHEAAGVPPTRATNRSEISKRAYEQWRTRHAK